MSMSTPITTPTPITGDDDEHADNSNTTMNTEIQQLENKLLQRELRDRIVQSRRNCYDVLLDVSITSTMRSHQEDTDPQQQRLQLPQDVYLKIMEYLPSFPLYGSIGTSSRNTRRCYVTDQSCQADSERMIQARSHQPLPHLQFFRFRTIGFKAGFGLTTNPNHSTSSTKGIRLNEEACGFMVCTKCFHYGTSDGKENVMTLMEWLLRTRYHSTDNVGGIAVDYEQNQLLLNWPNRQETLRLELPQQFQNKILYPMVQVWGGCSITVLTETVMADPVLEQPTNESSTAMSPSSVILPPPTPSGDDDDDDDHDSNNASSSGTSAVTMTPPTMTMTPPMTLPLKQSIARNSWCSEWMSLCKYRGLPRDTNPMRWNPTTPSATTTTTTTTTMMTPALPAPQPEAPKLKSILKSNRSRRVFSDVMKNAASQRPFPPIIDELDNRGRMMSTSRSLTSMVTPRSSLSPRPAARHRTRTSHPGMTGRRRSRF